VSKLSELVAVRVMGWRWSDHAWWYGGRGAWFDKQKTMRSSSLWEPEADIKDAIVVADHFTDYEIAKGGESYTVTINGVFTATEKTKELAITLAALRACGVPESEIEEARKQ